jgi:hypothetical protein
VSPVRRLIAGIGLLIAIVCNAAVAAPNQDIADYFKMYYEQRIVGGSYRGPLDFLGDAAAAHVDVTTVLKAARSRIIIVDRGNGYLQIDDSSGTDQILTMAVYRKTDGSPLLVVGSSNCADGCTFSVEFFVATADRLQSVPLDAAVPAIGAKQFIRPGHLMPKALAAAQPLVNYLPARVGTTLMLKPWYGYEAEEGMTGATRAAIRNIVLDWDATQGRFVNARAGS